jgi:carbamoyltransferase
VLTAAANVLKHTPSMLTDEVRLGLRAAGFMGDIPPVEFVSHHLSHAYSTYFCSPFDEAVIVTLDGSGEDNCTQIAIGRGDTVEVKENIYIPHSLGWFYAAFTAYLGFIPYRDEGKLMGLAALGEARSRDNPWPERLAKILKVTPGGYEVDPIYTKMGGHWFAERYTDALVKFVTDYDPDLPPIAYGDKAQVDGEVVSKYLLPRYVDLAWGVQEMLEQAARSLVQRAVADYGIRNVCVAGGVGLNCKMNGELLQSPGIEHVFVQPAANDAGTAVGAAMIVAQANGDSPWNRLDHVYYGPGFTNDQIRKALDGARSGRAGGAHEGVPEGLHREPLRHRPDPVSGGADHQQAVQQHPSGSPDLHVQLGGGQHHPRARLRCRGRPGRRPAAPRDAAR